MTRHDGSATANYVRACRMMLAELDGEDMSAMISAEIGDCGDCWRELATLLVRSRARELDDTRTAADLVVIRGRIEAAILARLDADPEPHWHTNERTTVDDEILVPLAHLVIEGFGDGSIDRLVAQLPEKSVMVDDIGRRCVTRGCAAELFAARAQAQANQRERARQRQEAMAAQPNPTRELVKAIRQAQAGVDAHGLDAHELMYAASNHRPTPRRRTPLQDALDGGDMQYHPIERGE